jgi:hypothetical protein
MNYCTAIRFAAIATFTAATAFSADWSMENTRIPFSFKAGTVSMPAGSYRVARDINRAVPMLTFRNVETGDAAVVVAPVGVTADEKITGNQAHLIFECAGTECAFRELQPGMGQPGYKTLPPKFKRDMGYNNSSRPEISRVVVRVNSAD